MSLDTAAMGIHNAIERAPSWQELLTSVAENVRHLIAFDAFAVSIVSESRSHLRPFFEHPPAPREAAPQKWWPMPPFVLQLLADLKPSAVSVDELFSQPEFATLKENDPATKEWLKRGFRHLLRLPVYRESRLVAIAMLYRCANRAFTQDEVDTFRHLPIVESVNMALAHDRKAELQFSLSLVKNLGEVADSIPALAAQLVDRLHEHYGWEHVSLFRVDEDRRKLTMLHQKCSGQACLPDGYEQCFGIGLLGHVLDTSAPVNVGDVRTPPWRDMYIVGMRGTRSEMCLPIPGSKLRWILNVESSLTDAFADEEQRSVELLLKQAGLILDRAASLELKAAILHWIADGVIQTTKDGMIQEMNPAALRLLGARVEELNGRDLAQFIDSQDELMDGDRDNAMALVQARHLEPTPIVLRRVDGTRAPVLISGASLPMELGGKVYVLTDLTLQRRVERMDILKQVFQQVASETRVPLALAASFLADAAHKDADVEDLLDKAQKQIRKADLPLERVLRLASASDDEPLPLSTVNLFDLLHSLVVQLPESQASAVRLHSIEGAVLARGAVHELGFCLQNALAFLLRHKAQSDLVDVRVGHLQDVAMVSLGLVSTADNSASPTPLNGEGREHAREFGLAEPVIQGLMQRMGGRYQVGRRGGVRYRFALQHAEKAHVELARAQR
jgi:PAS domain S-box-containing protein